MTAEIHAGQIWREVDPRRVRFVRITGIVEREGTLPPLIKIGTVIRTGDGSPRMPFSWERARGTRINYAEAGRFNGKRGGYVLHEDAPAASVDPRDPDYSRPGIFATHNCWKCKDGQKPCVTGNPRGCEYPHARND